MVKIYCFNSNIKILLVVILMITILAGCSSRPLHDEIVTKSNGSIEQNEAALELEGDNQKQVSYLLYNEAEENNNIVLSFYANFTKREIVNVELLQEDTVVTNNVKIRDTTINNNGQFIISLPNYIEKFNKIRLFDKNGDVIFTLNTGQYYLEKINIKSPSKGMGWYLSSYTTNENINTFNMDAVFEKDDNKPYNYQILLPKKLEEQNILIQKDSSAMESNTLKLHYESQIRLEEFGDYVNIAYDILVIQKDQENQFTLMKVNIPLSITNKIERSK